VRAGNVEEEFNKGFILPPLIVQLRKILDQYPDDTQILRVSNVGVAVTAWRGERTPQTCKL